jgi:bla regulator protein BlaR1
VDRTGLSRTFDYTIEWSGQLPGPLPPAGAVAPPPPDTLGKTFLQAVREQLGLKLTPSRATIRTIVIDHVERPSEN